MIVARERTIVEDDPVGTFGVVVAVGVGALGIMGSIVIVRVDEGDEGVDGDCTGAAAGDEMSIGESTGTT